VADQLSAQNIQPPLKRAGSPKGLPAADQFSPKNDFSIDPQILLKQFSFRHFTELIKIKDPLKRTFYEQQAIKGNWSSRQLKRQIGSLLLERTGLSKNKEALIQSVQNQQALTNIEDTIKDPYVLEFTGFKELPTYSETDLETSLLDKIQDFLIELGHGFCFEARQKRITIGNEHDRVDLVFYHRILKCHVLIELKVRAFSHMDVGQMNFYLNYFKVNVMEPVDNPPVGIILCTDKEEVKVEYATAGLDHQLFVSKYLVEMPSKEELERLLSI
jgi:predicted nuclease of restriction endonuclease-like (RecB) superfamily